MWSWCSYDYYCDKDIYRRYDMKFKTKEELIEDDNPHSEHSYAVTAHSGYHRGVTDAFKSFAERVEFYKKYEHSPYLFYKEQIKIYKLFEEWFKKEVESNYYGELYEYLDRQDMGGILFDWLFNYCFGDIK